jgi:hypothetical protein
LRFYITDSRDSKRLIASLFIMLNDLGLTSKDDEYKYKMQFVVARYHEYPFYLSLEKKIPIFEILITITPCGLCRSSDVLSTIGEKDIE